MPERKSSTQVDTGASNKLDNSAAYLTSSAPTENYDVVVVGAGPIGLGTAVGLRKRGIENLLVIDQTRAFRQVGQVVDLLPNGLKALKYLDCEAYEEVKKAGMRFLNPRQSNDEKTAKTTNQEQKPPNVSFSGFREI